MVYCDSGPESHKRLITKHHHISRPALRSSYKRLIIKYPDIYTNLQIVL